MPSMQLKSVLAAILVCGGARGFPLKQNNFGWRSQIQNQHSNIIIKNAVLPRFEDIMSTTKKSKTGGLGNVVEKFVQCLNQKDIDRAMTLVDDDIQFEDANYPAPFSGRDDLESKLRLMVGVSVGEIEIDNVAVDDKAGKVGILFREGCNSQEPVISSGGKGVAVFTMDEESKKIADVFWVRERNKAGEVNLKVLSIASKILEVTNSTSQKSRSDNDQEDSSVKGESATVDVAMKMKNLFSMPFESSFNSQTSSLTPPEQYYQAWNRRDVEAASKVFTDDVIYDDTAFPSPFQGKETLEKHLKLCAGILPPTFSFVIDDKVVGQDSIVLKWRVQNDGEDLPYTRGCSHYLIENGKIRQGVDVLEPAVFKTGEVAVSAKAFLSNVAKEPIRLIPIAVWSLYMYVVFFSDWFFGLPATALEQRTWEEVRDLSFNFFFVSPLLNLPFAPTVHPMLEAVFNFLLSYAALFAGFLSDDRKDKPNPIPMLPMVVGMQFLTSAFYLPYIASRSNEVKSGIVQEDLSLPAKVAESRLLGPALSVVGIGSIFWAIFARTQEYGGFSERLTSFAELLSIDRVGSSFIVDLLIFAAFQSWLVDDDIKRRGGMADDSPLTKIAKYVPFFGLAAYFTLRPSIPSKDDQ